MTGEDTLDTTVEDPQIFIRLEYEYLTVGQAGQLLQSIDGLYRATADAFIFEGFGYIAGPDVVLYSVPLTVQRADTSHSIEILLGLDPLAIPSIVLDGTKLSIAVPQWTAVVTAVGLFLQFGLKGYDKVLDILKKRAELKKLDLEVKKLERENSESARIQGRVNDFNEIVLAKNINEAWVNGDHIKSRRG